MSKSRRRGGGASKRMQRQRPNRLPAYFAVDRKLARQALRPKAADPSDAGREVPSGAPAAGKGGSQPLTPKGLSTHQESKSSKAPEGIGV